MFNFGGKLDNDINISPLLHKIHEKSYTPDPIFPPQKNPSFCHPTLLDLVVDDTEVVVSVVVPVVVMVWEVLVKVVVDNVVEVVVIVVPVLQWKEGKTSPIFFTTPREWWTNPKEIHMLGKLQKFNSTRQSYMLSLITLG